MSSQSLPGQHQNRVLGYVDGFNLYFGLRQAQLSKFRWLDIYSLVERLLKPNQVLVGVRYFTARIKGPDRSKIQRQRDYLSAIDSRPDLSIVYGRYLRKPDGRCFGCGRRWSLWEEKMTDVNIAAHLITDAHLDRFDTALLISGDSDLANAVQMARADTGKRVVAVFPPQRRSVDLEPVVDGSFMLNRTYIGKSLLEDPVTLDDGSTISCPASWK